MPACNDNPLEMSEVLAISIDATVVRHTRMASELQQSLHTLIDALDLHDNAAAHRMYILQGLITRTHANAGQMQSAVPSGTSVH